MQKKNHSTVITDLPQKDNETNIITTEDRKNLRY